MAKSQVQAENRAEVRAETETRARLDQAKGNRERLELEFGARWKAGKPGTEGRTQFDIKRRKAATHQTNKLDVRKVSSSLTSMNDAEAIKILDRADAKVAEEAAAAAALLSESAEEYALRLRETACARMRDGIRANMSTLHATFREVDQDGNGTICAAELERMLLRMGLQHSKPQVHDLFRHVGVRATEREFEMVSGTPCRCGGVKTWPCQDCEPKVSISFSMLRTCITDSAYRPPSPLPLEGAGGLTRINAWLETKGAKVGNLLLTATLTPMLTPTPTPILTPTPTPTPNPAPLIPNDFHPNPTQPLTQVLDLFRQWDASGDAQITPKEFRQAMKRLGLKLDAEEVGLPLDPPSRFHAHSHSPTHPPTHPPTDSLTHSLTKVATLFGQFDRDGSGGISYSEMRRALSAHNTKLSGQHGGKVTLSLAPALA
jgi:Ca2+-binding EF-hand superfamily protein